MRDQPSLRRASRSVRLNGERGERRRPRRSAALRAITTDLPTTLCDQHLAGIRRPNIRSAGLAMPPMVAMRLSHAGVASVDDDWLGGDDDPAERLAALGVLVCRGGLREQEPAIDFHLDLAACDVPEHVADHLMDAGVLGHDRAAEVDAVKRVVLW